MQIKIIGCSGSFPGPDSAASSYLVEADGFRLLMDLGDGALGALQRYADRYAIDAVCLSHLHGDHCLDLCSYAVARTYAAGRPPCRGCRSTGRPGRGAGSAGLAADPAQGRGRSGDGIDRRVQLHRDARRAPRRSARSRITAAQDEPPGGDVRLPDRSAAGGRWPTRRTPGESTALVNLAARRGPAAVRGVVRRRATRTPPGVHLTGRQAASTPTRPGRGARAHPPGAVERPGAGAGRGRRGLPRAVVAGPGRAHGGRLTRNANRRLASHGLSYDKMHPSAGATAERACHARIWSPAAPGSSALI